MIMIPFIALMLGLLAIGLAASVMVPERRSNSVATLFSLLAMLVVFAVLAYSIIQGSASYSESYNYYLQSIDVGLNFSINPLSLALLIMSSVVAFVTLLSGNMERESEKLSSALVLLFELAAFGLFTSANLFLFFIFWDVGVVALFFMIYTLGSANRRRAAMKFLIYELLASLLLLFAIMLIYFYTPVRSFDIQYIVVHSYLIPANVQGLVLLFLAGAFLINMPVFPFHLWLPEAHTEASTQGSMLLSGVLTKFGGYGMLLTFLMLPIASQYSLAFAVLAGLSALYASFVVMTQHDIKRIIAYTTIVEMSIVLVGIASLTTIGLEGAAFMMLAHGLAIAMLFLTAGAIGYTYAERDVRALRGVVRNAVSTAYTFLTGVFATTGVPLTAAFVGDVLIFLGAIQAFHIYGAIPLLAIIFLGAFLYYVVNKSVLATRESSAAVNYIEARQKAGYAVLLFFIFLFGILPFLILNFLNVGLL